MTDRHGILGRKWAVLAALQSRQVYLSTGVIQRPDVGRYVGCSFFVQKFAFFRANPRKTCTFALWEADIYLFLW
jgi:hypothetical protein